MEDHDQDVYGALEKNMNLKEQIKQKLRKYIREKLTFCSTPIIIGTGEIVQRFLELLREIIFSKLRRLHLWTRDTDHKVTFFHVRLFGNFYLELLSWHVWIPIYKFGIGNIISVLMQRHTHLRSTRRNEPTHPNVISSPIDLSGGMLTDTFIMTLFFFCFFGSSSDVISFIILTHPLYFFLYTLRSCGRKNQ